MTQRLDLHLVKIGAFASRARAQAAIAEGLVRVNGVVANRSAQPIGKQDNVAVDGDVHPYVSRGGIKLAAALAAMRMSPAGAACLDLGASTGGFTDVLLRAGARKVYAVDVGRGQLHATLRDDPRVISLEQTHARDLTPALVPGPIDFIVCDVSFISIKKALPAALALATPAARLVALVKPQFEVGPEGVGKGGIVKEALGRAAAENVAEWFAAAGWRVLDLIESPVEGGDGNREFLIGASKRAS